MKDQLTARERIAIKLIFLALKIVKPTQYSHEISKPLDDIEKIIKAESD